ncbi:bifunctional diguanylate cyclase/phosphodiesterase [Methylotenera sp.]|uniref:bifunctional diguanylate cyclase/phosphodiesterase n=1 Tax=Methylotenera sp. TaxID=2051956 RepID=UPI002EDB83E2
MYWYKEQNQASEIRQQVFDESANQVVSNIDLRITRFELMLRGVKGFYESSSFVKRAEYSHYVGALIMSETVPGFQAVAIVLDLPNKNSTQFITDMERRGYANFRIKPEGERQRYAVLSLIEPYSGNNLNAMGYDLLTNPISKVAIEAARDQGQLAVTSKLTLVQDGSKGPPAVVMYLPIYDTSKSLGTVEARRAAIIGWVSGPFHMQDFMVSLQNQLDKDLAIEIKDGNEVLFSHSSQYTDLYTKRAIYIGDKRWDIVIRSMPEFDARFPQNKLKYLVSGGLLLSLLFGWLVWLLGSGRERAELVAQQMTKELHKAKSDLECTLNAIPDVLFELDIEGCYYGYHTKNDSLLAAPANEIIGKNVTDVLPPKAAETCLAALHEASINGISTGQQVEIPFGDELRWFELSVAKRDNGSSENPHFVMISRDITDRKLANHQLSIAAIAFESQEGIFITDAKNIILRVNRSYTLITGYSADESIGKTPNILNSGRQDKHFYISMWDGINHSGSWVGEIWNRKKNGELFPCQLNITVVKDANGEVTNYVATIIDITLNKAASDEIKMLAFYDALTHLPNRRLMTERLTQALAASARSGKKAALLFLDIDHFKKINDALGHDIGDIFLQEVSKRISKCVRACDTVARLGGDEYVVLLEDLVSEPLIAASDVEVCGLKILKALSETYDLGNYECHSSASMGAVLFDKNNDSIEELLKQADIAMYEAKDAGRNTLRFFDPKMQMEIATRASLERELRIAIEQNQFELFYQMQVDKQHQIFGAEVLIRWHHPKRGLVSPIDFIPLAEETGLILDIGQLVLDASCLQLKKWELDPQKNQLKLSVNVSAKQFHQDNFVQNVESTIARHQINPSLLNLELTESMLLDDADNTISSMNQLRKIGVQFELDDFGTGYSSLQYLKKLPLYQLKIDRSFVCDISEDANDRALVTTIINMSHSLGLKVIAEGVETAEQLDFLKEYRCDHYQGYFFSKPLPIAEFEAQLK